MNARISIATLLFAHSLFNSSTSAQAPTDLASVRRDLPVVEVPSKLAGSRLVVLISGDGGWAEIEKDMAQEFNVRGISVIGLDLREYLRRTQRTPDDVGRDVARIFRAYSDSWRKPDVLLVGFSRGAGLAPFVISRLPQDLRARLGATAFIGLPQAVNMTFHWIDVVRDVKRASDIPVIPELQRAGRIRAICMFGKEESESGCRTAPPWVTRLEMPGGHHLEHAYRNLSDSILKVLPDAGK